MVLWGWMWMNKAFENIMDGIESLKSNKGFGGTIQTMYADGMLDKAKQIVQEVAEEYNNGWIPCSERLPEESGRYIICVHDDGFENFNKQNQEFVFTANYCDKKQMFEIPFKCDEKVYWKLMPNLCLHENKI